MDSFFLHGGTCRSCWSTPQSTLTKLPGRHSSSKVSAGSRQKKTFSTKLCGRNSILSKVNL